jgi:hypothetical protein
MLLATMLVTFFIHARAWSFLCDDAFISFRYARNLAEHDDLEAASRSAGDGRVGRSQGRGDVDELEELASVAATIGAECPGRELVDVRQVCTSSCRPEYEPFAHALTTRADCTRRMADREGRMGPRNAPPRASAYTHAFARSRALETEPDCDLRHGSRAAVHTARVIARRRRPCSTFP